MRLRTIVMAGLCSGFLFSCSDLDQWRRSDGRLNAFGRIAHDPLGSSYAEAIADGMARARAEYTQRSDSGMAQPDVTKPSSQLDSPK